MAVARKPTGALPAKARSRTLPGVAAAQQRSIHTLSKADPSSFGDDRGSPRLLAVPAGSLAAFRRSAPAQDSKGIDSRFCTHGPSLEFGGALDDSDANDPSICSLRIFASRLHTAISQSSVLLLEKLSTLKKKQQQFPALACSQEGQLIGLAQGVQAVSYYVQKWSATLSREGGLPSRPSEVSSAEEAMAILHLALPRIMVASSVLQIAIRNLVPRVQLPDCADDPTDEEFELRSQAAEKAQGEAEAKAELELRSHGISISDLYSIVLHMEHMVYQSSCLNNSFRPAADGGYPTSTPAYTIVNAALQM